MTSFKRWFGAGAIVLVALALIACPSMVPTLANEIGDMEFGAGDIGKTKTVSSLGGYFNVRNDATYDASSSDDTVVTASVADTTLTVTAKGSGKANVTVTAKDRDGTVAQTFSVTVAAVVVPPVVVPPVVVPPSNDPPLSKTIPDASLQVGDTKPLTVSRYFTDPDGDSLTYTAESDKPAIAAVTDPDADSMITITAVAAGTAMIIVTADDGTNDPVSQEFEVTVTAKPVVAPPNERPTSKEIPMQTLRVGGEAMLTLSDYFRDQDGDPLTYGEPESADPTVATVIRNGSMITITAVAVGETMITVTATDTNSPPVPETFKVEVKAKINAPTIVRPGVSPDLSLTVGDDPTLDLSVYFDDREDDALTYGTPASDDLTVAMVTRSGSKITITAVAVGETMITVTAGDGASNDGVMNDPALLTLYVTVSAMSLPPPPVPPAPPAPPTSITAVPQVDFAHDATDARDVTLSDHVMGATSYDDEVATTNSAVATGTVTDGVLSIMPVGSGGANLTVTARNAGGTFSLYIRVEVADRPNMPPRMKAGKEFGNVRLAANLSPAEDETGPSWTEDLDDYFEDPENVPLSYKVTAEQMPDNSGETVVKISVLPSRSSDTVKILAKSQGSAIITVVATDTGGNSSAPETFVITVVEDTNDPSIVGDFDLVPISTYTGANRLEVGDAAADVVKNVKFITHFDDGDLALKAGDLLTFSVKYVVSGTVSSSTTPADIKAAVALDDNKVFATATILPKTWDGTAGEKFTVTVEPKNKGGAAHDILIVATDLSGTQIAKRFAVRVNQAPLAQGAQDEPEMLGDFKGAENLVAGGTLVPVFIVAADGGYFSDGDMTNDSNTSDTLTCRFRPSVSGNTAPAMLAWASGNGNEATSATDSVTLNVTPQTAFSTAYTSMTVTVWCSDSFDETPKKSFRVEMTAAGKII